MATQPARGMRDFLPEDIRRREYVVRVIREVYDRYGFEPLETPAVENIETLLGKYGDEGNKLIFKILKRGEHEASGEADLALRYDLTVPLARVVAEYQAKLPKFFKRYQIQPVWRADRPARGRFREFFQCDIDAVGSASLIVEAELCSAASQALLALGFSNFGIRLNHRRILTGLLSSVGIPPDRHAAVLVELDKLEKIVREGDEGAVRQALTIALMGFGEVGSLIELLAGMRRPDLSVVQSLKEINDPILDALEAFLGAAEEYRSGVKELREILELTSSGPAMDRIWVDPYLARGLSYYTGAIMEISVPDLPGSLGGGGRYDNLIGTFLGRTVPACGFSLGLERILIVMDERKMFPESIAGRNADVMVTIWNVDSEGDALALAASLRREGLRVDVYPEPDKLSKQFKYASGRSIPFVTVVGDDEKAAGTVTVKDLRSGEQQTIARAEVCAQISKRLARPERVTRGPGL